MGPAAVVVATLLVAVALALTLRVAPRCRLPVLVGLGLAIRLALATRDPREMCIWPLCDDSYYYFNIAHNLVSGLGLRHDSFHTTTGFQPLFLFAITPLFWLIHDKLLVVNAVMVLQIGVGLVCCALFYRLARLFGPRWLGLLAVAVWATSESLISIDLNGMETNTALCLFLAIVYIYLRRGVLAEPAGLALWAGLGLLCGAAFLARADLALLLPALTLDALWRARRRPVASIALRVGVLSGCAALLMWPWLAYNLADSGSVVPGGGQAVRFLSLASHPASAANVGEPPLRFYVLMLRAALHALSELLAGVVPIPVGAALIGAALLCAPRSFLRRVGALWFVFAFLVLLLGAYAGYIFGPWYFKRYLTPFVVGYLLLLCCALAELRPLAARVPWLDVRWASALAAVALTWSLYKSLDDVAVVTRSDVPCKHYHTAVWLNEHTPPGAVIGVFQAGIVGYFVERPFHALDGKVNLEALDAMREGRIDEYVAANGIDYVLDFPAVLDPLFNGRARDKAFLSRQTLLAYRPEQIYRLRGEPAE